MAAESSKKKPSEWVKIVSKNDGHSFIVPRDVAMVSGFLRDSLHPDAGFSESSENTCNVDERYVSYPESSGFIFGLENI
jgi:transcription elongation factor B subunit 1